MALIKCYECSKKVSDAAAICPSCGAPKKRKTYIPVLACPLCDGSMEKISSVEDIAKKLRCRKCGHLA
ncbi:MAG: hypothetical protein QF731_02430 [Verrucomicrobiota bacterium]|jgi:hypothetical protein|nr:hypothetical protein [Verrucomicrobiota bacterium]